VVAAECDRLTPASHGRLMAEEIGENAELVEVAGAGHSVNLTRPEVVNDALVRLVERARPDLRRVS
jgi:pimeloyl-ACP methyl ester carboxylesterase